MKKQVSVKIDERLIFHLNKQANKSRYVEALIKADYQEQSKGTIIEAVKRAIIEDQEFIAQLQRMMGVRQAPVSSTIVDDVSFVPDSQERW